MESKTPEELAQEAFNAIPLVDTIKKAAPKVHETSLFWYTAGFEAGYAAALPKWVSVDQDNKPMEVIIDGTTYRLVK